MNFKEMNGDATEADFRYQAELLNEMMDVMNRLNSSSGYPQKNDAAYYLVQLAQSFSDSVGDLPSYPRYNTLQDGPICRYQDILGIKADITPEGYLKIGLPPLLSYNRFPIVKSSFLIGPIMEAMSDYDERAAANHHKEFMPIYKSVVILRCFYDRNRPFRALMDRFNIELKEIISSFDILIRYNWAFFCFHFYRTEPADKDYTEILIIRQKYLEEWSLKNPLPSQLPSYLDLYGTFENMESKAFKNIEDYQEKAQQLADIGRLDKACKQAYTNGRLALYQPLLNELYAKTLKFVLWPRNLTCVSIPESRQSISIKPNIKSSEIEISDQEGIFKISFPGRLPKKDGIKKNRFLPFKYRSQVNLALQQYIENHSSIRMAGCIVAFVYSYKKRGEYYLYRRNNSMDVTALLDEIKPYSQGFDPMYAPHFYMAKKADSDCTETYVMPVSAFPEWLKEQNIFRH